MHRIMIGTKAGGERLDVQLGRVVAGRMAAIDEQPVALGMSATV
jgi:hypothetical protein